MDKAHVVYDGSQSISCAAMAGSRREPWALKPEQIALYKDRHSPLDCSAVAVSSYVETVVPSQRCSMIHSRCKSRSEMLQSSSYSPVRCGLLRRFFAALGPLIKGMCTSWRFKRGRGARRAAGARSARLQSLNPPTLFLTFPGNGRGARFRGAFAAH